MLVKNAVIPHHERVLLRPFSSSSDPQFPTAFTTSSREALSRLYRRIPQPHTAQSKANYSNHSTTAETMSSEPTGLIAKSGIELLTFS